MDEKQSLSPEISDLQMYLFHEGTNYYTYKMLGAKYIPAAKDQDEGYRFAVWAPNAVDVSLVGDFNGWEIGKHSMEKLKDSGGIWYIFMPGMDSDEFYKYAITTREGEVLLKADPYGYCFEVRPSTASVTYRLDDYDWTYSSKDQQSSLTSFESPMSIYEVHVGSFKQHEDGSLLTYRELAKELIPYVLDMGFTHIELMPLTEYPYDDSWGYQVTGYFAATSRYGSPKDLMYFVDRCHEVGLKVIMDWVPAHFPKDAHGLARFDGTPLYEYENPRLGEHAHWGTLVFDYGKPEVRSFLISSAIFWLDVFRVDGLRVDAVSSMLYLDYGRQDGEWVPNKYGGNENLEAIEFIQELNKAVFARFPDALMIAEESTSFSKVTTPVYDGGLGFNYKWNMGWMHDYLRYFQIDPYFRKYNHNLLTFVMMYAYSENFILPLSHDEVVHGKKSLLDKMYGSYEEKFATLRAFFGIMMALPGKKLLFMGGEIGQFIEWNFKKGLDWNLLDYDKHRQLQTYVRDLNNTYKKYKSLYQLDTVWTGFEWIEPDDRANSVVAFLRRGRQKGEFIIIVSNFTPVERKKYPIRVPTKGEYYELISSNWEEYGGESKELLVYRSSLDMFKGEKANVIHMDIPPLSTVYLRKKGKRSKIKPLRIQKYIGV